MDLDRRKHDVDVIERVIGGIRDSSESGARTLVVDLGVPSASSARQPTLELTLGIDDSDSYSDRRRRY